MIQGFHHIGRPVGETRLFQPELHAGNGSAALAVPLSRAGPRRFATPDWRGFVARRNLGFEGIGLGTELTLDLGDAIGSRAWWLGLGACTALCGTALWLGSGVVPIREPAHTALTPTQREMLRPQAIAPLARGGATGVEPIPNNRLVVPLAEAPERPRLELTARLNSRDNFESVLRRAGVGQADIASVVALVRPLTNLGSLPGGTDMDLVLGRRETRSVPRPLELLGFRAAFDLRLAVARQDGALVLRKIPIAVDSTPLRVQGLAGGNIERSLRGAGIPARLANAYVKTLGYAVDFQHGVDKRARFDIVIAQDKAETGDIRHGELLFAGLSRTGKEPIEIGRWDFGGKPQYFRAGGDSVRKGLMRTPVDGARLTSGFGMRFHPLLAYSRMHQGVDFGAPWGSPIYAAASGVVGFAGRHGGHGNYIMLKHNKELNTAYAHLSRFAVRAGQSVGQGQVIGYVGSTGISTGPHLHYETWFRGRVINPMQLKFTGGMQLSGNDLGQFMAQMNRWRQLSVSGGSVAEPRRETTLADKRRGRRA
ncbi:MAG: hypothetical protein DCF31_08245 [Alphaproteobacteria bacterium]|nr:MAG: hypothetical protein DCF31_08245 [Alphaproteobacteria bacterium]